MSNSGEEFMGIVALGSLYSRFSPFQGSGKTLSHSVVTILRNLSRRPRLFNASAFVADVPPSKATTFVIFVSHVPIGAMPEPVILRASMVPRMH